MDLLNKYKRMPATGENYGEALFIHNTPAAFHTYRAFDLFNIAIAGGWFMWQCLLNDEQHQQWLEANKPLSILKLAEIPYKLAMPESSPIRTQAHLAYWCICASTYLGLDRGSTTSWEDFETLFQLPRRSLSKATNPLEIERDTKGRIIGKREEYTAAIDEFFAALEKALNPEQ